MQDTQTPVAPVFTDPNAPVVIPTPAPTPVEEVKVEVPAEMPVQVPGPEAVTTTELPVATAEVKTEEVVTPQV